MGSDEGRRAEGLQWAAQLADTYQRKAHLVHHFLFLFMSPRWKLLQAKGRVQVGGLDFHFCLFASSKDPLPCLNAFSRVQSSRKSGLESKCYNFSANWFWLTEDEAAVKKSSKRTEQIRLKVSQHSNYQMTIPGNIFGFIRMIGFSDSVSGLGKNARESGCRQYPQGD